MISVTLLLKSVCLAFGPVLIFRPRRCSLCPDGRRESEMNLHFKGCVTHRVDSLRVQTPPMAQARGLRTTCKVRIQHTRGRVRTWWPHCSMETAHNGQVFRSFSGIAIYYAIKGIVTICKLTGPQIKQKRFIVWMSYLKTLITTYRTDFKKFIRSLDVDARSTTKKNLNR